MKIAALHAFPLRLKVVQPGYAANESAALPGSTAVIVRIDTSAGISRLGEATAGPVYLHQTLSGLLDWLRGYAKALDGADPVASCERKAIVARPRVAYPSVLYSATSLLHARSACAWS
jgi:hypothetical protein